jgi:hypothetical protein
VADVIQWEYLDEPSSEPPADFRCGWCLKWVEGEGEWVHRWPGVPGHFVAVHREGRGCRAPGLLRLLGMRRG